MDFTRLEHFIDSLETLDVPACDIAVFKGHKEVFRHSSGFSDAACTKPVTKNDIHWLYSMSKVITCTAAMRLVERGKLSLDDEVAKYLPEFANVTVKDGDTVRPAKTKMLVWHLFSMRSGMDYDLWSPSLKAARENKNATTRELVRAMANDPLLFDPGADYKYSLSHDVLAAIIEVVSGKTFYQYLCDELFTPLGMKNIGFHPTAEQLKHFTQQYCYDDSSLRSFKIDNNCAYMLSDVYESGGAGLFATLDEYAKVADALANFGTAANGYQVLKPETINLMRQNRQDTLCDSNWDKHGYGYGLGVRTLMNKDAARSNGPVGEFGWDGAAASYCLIDPDNSLCIVFTTQILGCRLLYGIAHPEIRNLTYRALGIDTPFKLIRE